MQLAVDHTSTTPPYEQVRVQLLERMQRGSLPAGSRLPTVRQLAADLDLAPGTVARAYKELESIGAIETHGRAGTVVAWSADAAERAAQQLVSQLVATARESGVTDERLRELFTAALD